MTPEQEKVVALLRQMAAAMKGGPYRSRAYARAAEAIQARRDFERLAETGRFQVVEGVGPAIERKIVAFLRSGERPEWLDDPRKLPRADARRGGISGIRAREAAKGLAVVPKSYHAAPFPDAPDLHVHTTWSDGTLTLEEVVLVAERLGAKAIGISDHSGSLHIARGLKPDEVREQWRAIDALQDAHPDLRILKGTECDILRDGRLDHPDELLRGFDYVIGSLHSQLRLPSRDQTPRVLVALEHERLTILGHPTTRVPGSRPRADLDLAKVFRAAAEKGVALEVNGNPGRLDLDAPLARKALAAGARLALGSDAHSAREMLAFAEARRIAHEAGAGEEDLVNFDLLGLVVDVA